MNYLITNADYDYTEVIWAESLDDLINITNDMQNDLPDDTGKLYAYALDNPVWESL